MTMRLMTQLVVICSALTVLIGNAYARDARPVLYGQGLLWKIERTGWAPSYLYGTIHSEDPRVLKLPSQVQRVFDSTRGFVMEAVLDANAMQMMAQTMLFQDGRSLKQVLTPGLYARAVKATSTYGLPEAAVISMKPWALMMTLSMPKPETGLMLDLLLMQQAAAQGKTVAGLETIEEQISVMDRLPLNEQIIMLEDTLKFLPERDAVFNAMHDAYLARDLARLVRLAETQQAKGNRAVTEKLMHQLLDVRNHRMVSRMETHFKQGSAFIAIGALHLPGEAGVLNLLVKQGYRVSAVY